jgi:hypothetical protein
LSETARVQASLRELASEDTEVVVEVSASDAAMIQPEDGEAIALKGSRVLARASQFELEDLERVARFQFELIQSLHDGERRNLARINETRAALAEQARRIVAKSQSHGAESTAGKLYGQQLEFIDRLMQRLDT